LQLKVICDTKYDYERIASLVKIELTCQNCGGQSVCGVSMPAACVLTLVNSLLGKAKWLPQKFVKGCAVVAHDKVSNVIAKNLSSRHPLICSLHYMAQHILTCCCMHHRAGITPGLQSFLDLLRWVQAVAQGMWLVIEDLNLAPPEVLAALVPLLGSRQLHLPQRAQVINAAPGFQLLASITTAPGEHPSEQDSLWKVQSMQIADVAVI